MIHPSQPLRHLALPTPAYLRALFVALGLLVAHLYRLFVFAQFVMQLPWRHMIIIDHSKVDSSLVNFPVFIGLWF
jgi:hypothetical protein